jgi:hypothetical protein
MVGDMRIRSERLTSIAALCLALCAVHPLLASGFESNPPSVSTEATGIEGRAALEVRVFGDSGELEGLYGGAEVFIDNDSQGWAPFASESIKPGTYRIRVSAPGYYPASIIINFSEKTRYRLRFSLAPVTGLVEIEVDPADASVIVDGIEKSPGSFELKAGKHRLVARRFASVEKSVDFEVAPLSTTHLRIALEKAAFDVSSLSSSRAAFNPRNSAQFARAVFGFRVSSYGSGRLEIRDESGNLVYEKDFPSFATWRQEASWDGRAPDRRPLPDGIYTAILEARPAEAPAPSREVTPLAEATNAESLNASKAKAERREASVRIDSSLVIEPFGTAGAGVGLLYSGDPRRLSPGVLGLELGATANLASSSAPAFSLSAAYAVDGFGFAAALAVEPQESGSDVDAAASARYSFLPSASPIAAALQLRGLYTSGASPLAPGFETAAPSGGFSLEASLPLAFAAGPFRLGLEPGFLAAIPTSSAGGLESRLLLGSGLWLSGSRYEAGISARLLALASTPLSLASPVYAALEGRYLLDGTPLVLSACLAGAFEADAESSFRLGIGLGLLL